MPEVKVSRAARGDLVAIDDFGAERFGDVVADAHTRGLGKALDLLSRYPHLGELHPDFGRNVRCKVFRSHRILYRIDDETVFILRVLHHSQQVPAKLKP